ncbi:MAG: hypothetical protein CMI52_01570 [Parcubacteria group bacterium]|nr:hypothetical protein [Parcubacteria group bacterium]
MSETPPVGGGEKELVTCEIDDPAGTLAALNVMLSQIDSETEEVGSDTVEAIQNVVTKIFQNGNEQSYVIAGDFLDEDGNPRDRYIMRLDEMVAVVQHPVMKDIALKVIPKKHNVSVEVGIHKQIQNKAKDKKNLRVPHVLGTIDLKGADYKGVLMERLPQNASNKSLQGLLSAARSEGVRLIISDDVFGDTLNTYEDLHDIGFVHKDINEGNLYVLNAEIRDVVVGGKTVRFVGSGEVVLLDFEQTVESGVFGSVSQKQAIESEISAVDDMLSQYAVDVDGSASDVEIAAEL